MAHTNLTAVVKPRNGFSFGAAKINRSRGTVILNLNVPAPGVLAVSGKGLKARAAGSRSPTTIPVTDAMIAPASVRLKVKARGKLRAQLNRTGQVKARLKVTYTPTDGDPATQKHKVVLVKNPR